MRQTFASLQFLLWTTGIHALSPHYPRHEDSTSNGGLEARAPADDSAGAGPSMGFISFEMPPKRVMSRDSIPDRVDAAIQMLAAKYGSEVPARSVSKDSVSVLHDRDNTYSVANAIEPTVDNAAGIDQDGTDYSYFTKAQFGSEGKQMYMLVDTGASTTWVMGSGCTSPACAKHNTFGPNDSKTYKDSQEVYNVSYGSGDVSGHVVSDTVSVAGLKVTMPFGVANVTSDQFSQFPFEGILGLSMVPGTWLTYIKDAKLIDANIFGIALSRSSDKANDGEIALGAPNKAKYTGDLSYTSVNSGNSWAIPMDDVLYDGKSVGVKNRLAYIDTGTTFVFGPPDDVAAMYKLIPNSATTDNGRTYTIPCDAEGEVAFAFSGKTWTVSVKDFRTAPTQGVCFGNVYGHEFVAGAWLVGDMFLKNVYSVFDMDQKRIGFAARAVSSSSDSSSSSAGTSSTSAAGSTTTLGTPSATTTPSASGVGLTPDETPAANAPADSGASSSPGSSTTGPAPSDTATPGSAGVRSYGVGTFGLLISVLAIVGIVI